MSQGDQKQPDFGLPGYIQPGDLAPWWNQGRHQFVFDRAAGRYIVLGFCGDVNDAFGQAALAAIWSRCHLSGSGKTSFFCVVSGPLRAKEAQEPRRFVGLDFIWDTDGVVHRAYGVISRRWIVLDPTLRVIKVIPFTVDGAHISALAELLDALPPPSLHLGFPAPAPVLVLSNVFEPAFCQHLIDSYEADGGRESGFMEEVNGKTVELHDPDWKRRSDFIITDDALIRPINARLGRRIGLMVQRVFQFKFSRIERYLVACYACEKNGHFGPHRDDTVKGTKHRKFAVSINLNDDFDGGGISFPEFSPDEFKVPIGAAVIFSASILHCVARVTRGRRYAFLPFIHDEEAERVRLADQAFVQPRDATDPNASG